MRGERRDHTLGPTALVHEALLRIVSPLEAPHRDRPRFFGAAARAMRRVLADHARRRGAAKRSAGRRVPLTDLAQAPRDELLARLDEETTRLAELDPALARIVELRFFGGLTVAQTAAILGASPRTVKREWRIAKGWLHRRLARSGGDGDEA